MAILRVCSMNKGKEWLVIYPGTQDGGWETPTSSQSRISRKCQDMQCQFREIKSTRKGTHLCLENSGGNELLWLDFHACDICYRRSSSENCQSWFTKARTLQNRTTPVLELQIKQFCQHSLVREHCELVWVTRSRCLRYVQRNLVPRPLCRRRNSPITQGWSEAIERQNAQHPKQSTRWSHCQDTN